MSHSDHTKPYRARLLEQGAAVEYHDHSRGDCVLVPLHEFADKLEHDGFDNRPRCGWELGWTYLNEHPVCGCSLCTNQAARKVERRRARREGKRQKRNWLSEVGRDASKYEDFLDD